MAKNISVKITTSDGKTYPCRLTLGAMRRFKQETGKEADQIAGASELAVLVWCCCLSASKADGVAFDVSLDDFCDRMDMESIAAFSQSVLGDEKKTKA